METITTVVKSIAGGWRVPLRQPDGSKSKSLYLEVGQKVIAEGVERTVAKVTALGGLAKIELEGE
jgi:hypothetical protein